MLFKCSCNFFLVCKCNRKGHPFNVGAIIFLALLVFSWLLIWESCWQKIENGSTQLLWWGSAWRHERCWRRHPQRLPSKLHIQHQHYKTIRDFRRKFLMHFPVPPQKSHSSVEMPGTRRLHPLRFIQKFIDFPSFANFSPTCKTPMEYIYVWGGTLYEKWHKIPIQSRI